MKTCKMCHNVFEESSNTQRPQLFCGRKCRDFYCGRIRNKLDPHLTTLKTNTCPHCETRFFIKEGSNKKFCSHHCNIERKKRHTEKALVCDCCSKTFLMKRDVPARWCSDKCRSLARYRRNTGYPEKAPRTKSEYGGGYVNKQGYRIVYKDHPNANKRTKIILEHIYIMSTLLGRPMKKGETVHHKNGIRSDNRTENLELWSTSQPPGQKIEDKITWAIEFLESYGHKVEKT